MANDRHNPMRIYTRTGDDGTTSLFSGGRVPKYHLRVESYGTVDELNSVIGLARAQQPSAPPTPTSPDSASIVQSGGGFGDPARRADAATSSAWTPSRSRGWKQASTG